MAPTVLRRIRAHLETTWRARGDVGPRLPPLPQLVLVGTALVVGRVTPHAAILAGTVVGAAVALVLRERSRR